MNASSEKEPEVAAADAVPVAPVAISTPPAVTKFAEVTTVEASGRDAAGTSYRVIIKVVVETVRPVAVPAT
jgi:hypothetical protein